MPFLQVTGGEIYYEDQGSGIPIVFAHGAGGNHMSWWQQVPYFQEKYRCITFDQRGFGRSIDETGETRFAFVRDLEELLDHLDIDQLLLVAQSMGGHSCMPFTVKNTGRVIKLVMADTFLGITEPSVVLPFRQIQENVAQAQLKPGNFVNRALGPEFLERNPVRSFLYQEINTLNPPRDTMQRMPPEPGEGIMSSDLQELNVPILYIVGQDDGIIPPYIIQEAHRMTPNSKIEIVPGAGHSVYFEKPDVFNYLVSRFFDEEI